MSSDPYRLIDETALRVRRRWRENLLLPVLPPALVVALGALLGRLPLELGFAAALALGVVLASLANQRFGRREAASFLDDALGAKEHFLTLATVEGTPPLRPAVEARAASLIGSLPPPLPPRQSRPAMWSGLASLLLFAFLWWLPQMPLFASGGSTLDQIADELGASGDAADRALARELKVLRDSLRDPSLSKDEKQKKVEEMIDKIEKQEQQRQQAAAAGSKGSGGSSGKQGEQEKPEGQQQGEGKQSGKTQQSGEGQQQSGSGARGQAKKELQKIAGELSGGTQPQQQSKAEQGEQKKPDPSGGGLQGPESGAKERKPSEKEASGNQPGKSPEKSGGDQKPGDAEGEAKAEQGQQPQQPNPANPGSGAGQGAGEGEGPGKRPSKQASDQPADRFFKAGEGAGGRIVDGRYVRIRLPEEERRLEGSEEVAKPGEVVSEVPYGNAPLPPPGAPGDVGTEQPVPLEYRGALGR